MRYSNGRNEEDLRYSSCEFMLILRVLALLTGLALVAGTLISVLKTFVLPRSANVFLAHLVFDIMEALFRLRLRGVDTYEGRDRIMAIYAPLSLFALTLLWVILVLLGYTFMYWALDQRSLALAFTLSGSSLLTLGFAESENLLITGLTFSEAMIGLSIVALLIAYLPSMYGAFARRELAVTLLEVRAGSPPSAIEWIKRAHRLNRLDRVGDAMVGWEEWFGDIEESHTSLAALVHFRSPRPERSWITAAGAVLDTASLMVSTIDVPHDVRCDLCIRAGYLALRHIADAFAVRYNADPSSSDPISIAWEEFDLAYEELLESGVPLKPDREQAWRDYRGWRVNYDTVLLALAALTMAPYAPWTSDRSVWRPPWQRRLRS